MKVEITCTSFDCVHSDLMGNCTKNEIAINDGECKSYPDEDKSLGGVWNINK